MTQLAKQKPLHAQLVEWKAPVERLAEQKSRTERPRKAELADDNVLEKGRWRGMLEEDPVRRTGLGMGKTPA